jgi:alpha-mannosidase
MLRASFPVAVQSDEVTCEIQFGHLKRPTHRNTTWDVAKFEICAQKWIDLSERGYGVALLNDCKYGHKAVGNTLDIHLLRTPSYPDPVADRARHEFTYSLYPHAGDVQTGGVIQAAYELNIPLRVMEAGDNAASSSLPTSWVQIEQPNIVLEAVKKAEDSDDFILRLYEAHGARTQARLRFGFDVSSAELTDLMEENGQPLPVDGNAVEIAFRPFEVHTVKIR